MYNNLIALLFLLLVSLTNSLPILVQQVCRHGDRSPIHFFPNNAHKNEWMQGPGYLSPIGEEQLFENGVAFRKLWYSGLLSEVVYPSEIEVISSDKDRAIMSANSFLAALYPPTDGFVFEPGLNWQAFPTHTISSQLDYYLDGTLCPHLDAVLAKLWTSKNYTEFIWNNQMFISHVCAKAGYSPAMWNINSMNHVHDNLICDAAHNLSIPNWATADLLNNMTNIINSNKQFQYSDAEANFLYTGGGPLLGLMLNNIMEKKANNLTQKFIYYSAHDITVLSFMGNLDQPVGPNPPYASCAFLELYQDENNEYKVQLLFKNSTLGQMQEPRMIPGCNALKCDLDVFVDVVKDKVNMDPKAACYSLKK